MKKQFFKYLIEIIIIVIGVLVAFYVTNWGDEIKKRNTEKEIISQIYFELNDNLVDLKNDLALHRNSFKSQLNVQKYIDAKTTIPVDSLMMDFYWMTKEEYIFPNTSAFENLKNVGMGIIKNDSLRDLITLAYNNYFPRISKGNNLHPDINEYTSAYFQNNFNVNRDPTIKYTLYLGDSLAVPYPRNFGNDITQLIGYIPKDKKALKNDEHFRFLLSEILYFRIYKLSYYNRSIQTVDTILKRIKKHYPEVITTE